MMNNKLFDEVLYPMAWRLNSEECGLSYEEKEKIVLLNTMESERLWNQVFPFNILMDIHTSNYSIINKTKLDFNETQDSAKFFHEKLNSLVDLFFFWGRKAAAIVPSNILIKAWDDFFYPSDESSVIYIPNDYRIIFSYEETFFYAQMLGENG